MIPERLQERLKTKLYPKWSPTMYRITLGSFIALALLIPLVIVALPFIEFLNGMAAQPKGKAQMTFGRVYGEEIPVERAPVEGTVPRDYHPYMYDDFGNKVEDAQQVGELLENPLPRTMENLRRGRKMFDINCAVCHGPMGQGDGPVTGPNRFPAPPSLTVKTPREYKDGTIFHIITKGKGKMPAYGTKLRQEDRWKIVHYLRAIQRAMNPKPEDFEKK